MNGYLGGYLLTGAGVLVCVAYWRSNDADWTFSRQDVLRANPGKNRLWLIFLSELLLPLLVSLCIVVAWPLAIGMLVEDYLVNRRRRKFENYPEFRVAPGDLLRMCTVAEVERTELVRDPMHAAPTLPFGHLNAAWNVFLDRKASGDVLWSFRSRWVNRWGKTELHVGYVWVSGKVTKSHFLTQVPQTLDDKLLDSNI